MEPPSPLVIDNFLPQPVFTQMQETIMSTGSPWFYSNCIDYNDESEADDVTKFQFYYLFYEGDRWLGVQDVVAPLMSRLNYLSLLRVKANLQPRSSELTLNSFHIDLTAYQNPEHVTAVYYLNTCDGETVFEIGKKVKSVANRIVMFPGSMPHAGTSVTDSKVRCLLNINFIQKVDSRWIPPTYMLS